MTRPHTRSPAARLCLEKPTILVLNKMDRLAADEADTGTLARRLMGEAGGHKELRAVPISALTGEGLAALQAAIDEVLPLDPVVRTTLELDAGDGATLALMHEFGRVLSTRYEENRVVVEADVPESLERRLRAR